jgi:membrane fusion protein, multidrug efflux system
MSGMRRGSGSVRRMAARAGFVVAVVASGAVGTMVLHGRATPEAELPMAAPLVVATETVHAAPGYAETRRFLGRVEPMRATALAFERGGRIVEMLAEEGDRVAAGAAVARLDVALLEVARERLEAQRAAQEAAAELARLTWQRQQGLSDRATSAQRSDEARLGLAAAEAALRATEAELAGIAVDLDKSVLRAPFAGTVAARDLHEGAVVEAGRPVLTLVENGRVRVRAGFAPDVAAGLVPGRRVGVEVAGGPVLARLVALRPDLDAASRTVAALLELDRPAGTVPLGEVVTMIIEVPRAGPGFWIPVSALAEGVRGTWTVWALREGSDGHRAVPAPVELVAVEGEWAFVRGPLRDGERIVGTGTHRVREGQDVLLAEAEGRP